MIFLLKDGNHFVIKSLANLFHFVLFTSLFIALVALGMVYQVEYLFQIALSLPFYGFVFFGTLCSYNLHWLFTPAILPPEASFKAHWHVKHRRLHAILAAASLIECLYFVALLH